MQSAPLYVCGFSSISVEETMELKQLVQRHFFNILWLNQRTQRNWTNKALVTKINNCKSVKNKDNSHSAFSFIFPFSLKEMTLQQEAQNFINI